MAGRSRRKAAPTNQASQGTLTGTNGSSGKPDKPAKKRRSDEQLEADLQRKLEAVRARRRIAKISDNKPLVAAYRAARALKRWLSDETYALVDAEIQEYIDGKQSPEDLGDETDEDVGHPVIESDIAEGDEDDGAAA